jgi:outer membrane protein TolC
MTPLKNIGLAVAALALATAAPAQDRQASEPVLTLEQALSLAIGEQPSVVAYRREAQASEEAAVAARSLPDPEVSVGIQDFPVRGENAFSPIDDDFTMYTVGIMREQVRRSKREAEAARIRAEALVSRRQGTARELQVHRAAMIAWIDAVEAKNKQSLLERLIADLRAGRKVLEGGIAGGSSTPALVLQMDAEIALGEAQLADARRAEARARGELERWIGKAASRPLPASLPLIEAPKAVPASIFRFGSHPHVLVAEAEQQVATRRVDVARQERKPDISWSVMVGFRPKYGELVSGQVSIPLQLNRRQRQDRLVAEAQARADAAGLRAEDEKRELERQYRVALADYEGAEAELARIDRDAIPALEAAFKASEARYGSGAGTLEEPFLIVRRYVETTIKSVETRAKRDRAVAEMLYVLGESGQ